MRVFRILLIAIVLLAAWDLGWWLGFGVEPYSPWALKQMVNEGNAPIIMDVRTPAEFRSFHIPGAVNVPFPAPLIEFAKKAPDPTDPIVVVCMTGHRSPPVVRELTNGGYTNVTNLTWGMLAWKLFGGETESGK